MDFAGIDGQREALDDGLFADGYMKVADFEGGHVKKGKGDLAAQRERAQGRGRSRVLPLNMISTSDTA
jgi:hypothetical protein